MVVLARAGPVAGLGLSLRLAFRRGEARLRLGPGRIAVARGSIPLSEARAIARFDRATVSLSDITADIPTPSGPPAHIAASGSLILAAEGYDATLARANGFLSEMLEERGWATYALGKWHLTKDADMSDAGPKSSWPLQRGFARVTRADGATVHAGAALAAGEAVSIKFGDQVIRQAVIDGPAGAIPPPPPAPQAAGPRPAKSKPPREASNQGDLF